jgi:hypothetical protein
MIPESVIGTLDVLNVNAGDLNLSFNTNDPEETAKARRVVEDMLSRGYTILVQWGDRWRRVTKFYPKRDTYQIEVPDEQDQEEKTTKKKIRRVEVPARKTKATGIAPTAGG